jgi:hypothetical protein
MDFWAIEKEMPQGFQPFFGNLKRSFPRPKSSLWPLVSPDAEFRLCNHAR